jgi:luciferase family oxidoreductase group 1
MIPLSVLDLCPVTQGADAATALRNTLDLARHAEGLGFGRYWLAEHHNMPGVASAATSVIMAAVAAATRTIRVGAGGIMLPNHAPLVIAEQFGTLEALYPGRIDLGLGRAPGTDQRTAQALRRDMNGPDDFPGDVREIQAWLGPAAPGDTPRAVPPPGTDLPIWILGSSLYGAQLAAAFGLPYAFASHFAPDHLEGAVAIYRARFQPSPAQPRPHVMLGVSVVAADTDAQARRLFTSAQQQFLNMRRGRPGQLPPPVDDMDALWSPFEKAGVMQALSCAIVGSPETVREGLAAFVARTGADELMVTCNVFDHAARLRSYAILAGARDRLPVAA